MDISINSQNIQVLKVIYEIATEKENKKKGGFVMACDIQEKTQISYSDLDPILQYLVNSCLITGTVAGTMAGTTVRITLLGEKEIEFLLA